jgi:CCAAT-binding transcription factor (CBF-B/NF-YA) subunit B
MTTNAPTAIEAVSKYLGALAESIQQQLSQIDENMVRIEANACLTPDMEMDEQSLHALQQLRQMKTLLESQLNVLDMAAESGVVPASIMKSPIPTGPLPASYYVAQNDATLVHEDAASSTIPNDRVKSTSFALDTSENKKFDRDTIVTILDNPDVIEAVSAINKLATNSPATPLHAFAEEDVNHNKKNHGKNENSISNIRKRGYSFASSSSVGLSASIALYDPSSTSYVRSNPVLQSISPISVHVDKQQGKNLPQVQSLSPQSSRLLVSDRKRSYSQVSSLPFSHSIDLLQKKGYQGSINGIETSSGIDFNLEKGSILSTSTDFHQAQYNPPIFDSNQPSNSSANSNNGLELLSIASADDMISFIDAEAKKTPLNQYLMTGMKDILPLSKNSTAHSLRSRENRLGRSYEMQLDLPSSELSYFISTNPSSIHYFLQEEILSSKSSIAEAILLAANLDPLLADEILQAGYTLDDIRIFQERGTSSKRRNTNKQVKGSSVVVSKKTSIGKGNSVSPATNQITQNASPQSHVPALNIKDFSDYVPQLTSQTFTVVSQKRHHFPSIYQIADNDSNLSLGARTVAIPILPDYVINALQNVNSSSQNSHSTIENSKIKYIAVNSKQYLRILLRRTQRIQLASRVAITERKPFLHDSRHDHAMRRPRHPSGRFYTKDEIALMKKFGEWPGFESNRREGVSSGIPLSAPVDFPSDETAPARKKAVASKPRKK